MTRRFSDTRLVTIRDFETRVWGQSRSLTTCGSYQTIKIIIIGTDTYRSAIYDFLLTFHSNYGPISYRFWDNGDFSRKSQNFLTPMLQRFPLELGTGARGQKTGPTKKLTISSAVWIQSNDVTDGRTDTGRQQRRRLRIASHGKKTRLESCTIKILWQVGTIPHLVTCTCLACLNV